MTRTNISNIQEALRARGVRPRKKWGQSFLKERGLLRLMVRAAGVEPGSLVLEVGAGPGCLTEALCEAGASVVAVEIDADLVAVARELLADRPDVRWVQADILETKSRINPQVLDVLALEMKGSRTGEFRLIANLPYNVSVPVILGFLELPAGCRSMTVMVQKEVADRLRAAPGSADYGYVSVLMALVADVAFVRHVAAEAFWPQPKVSSAVLKITPLADGLFGRAHARDGTYRDFKMVAKGIFAHRRKKWLKSLLLALDASGSADIEREFRTRGFDPDLRAEVLPPAKILGLSQVARELGLLPSGRGPECV